MKKKLLSILLACAAVTLAACGGSSAPAGSSSAAAPATSAASSAAAGAASYKVGICQLVQHEALDAATKGFKEALTQALGDKVSFDEQNAQGDSNTCSTIINGFVSNKVNLILANATPALQAAAAGTKDIPILGTSITEYGVALEIKDFKGTVGSNISGTSDLAPLDGQADMVKELFPNAKKIGLFYCSAEANSKYQVDTIKKFLEEKGYSCEMYAFSDSNDLSSVLTNAVNASDVIYIPTDNTAASNAELINNICSNAKKPVVTGEEGICAGCGVAALSISYYDLGVATGKMAAKVLTGEADIKSMPIEYAPTFTKKYNPDICKKLGINVPSDYKPIGQ